MSALKYWLWLSTLPKVGARGANKILDVFGTPERAFFARDDEIDSADTLTADEKSALKQKSLSRTGKIMHDCSEHGFRILTLNDAEYPERLRNIFDPPVVIYTMGRLPVIDEEAAVAIVGTRKCTPYGIKNAERIGYEIARDGGVVVSGLARGIDSAAAAGALRAGGRVVGVLGSGLDIVYPKENGRLFEDVCVNGGIISEYAPGTPPAGANFPVRNRIMSGISLGVLVIEAPRKSGALITVARALEQGKDVFAVPGNIDAYTCEGSNELLKEGAIAVTSGRDVISEYINLFPDKLTFRDKDSFVPLDKAGEQRLIKKESLPDKKRQDETKKLIDKKIDEEYIDFQDRPEDMSDDEYTVMKALTTELQADEIVEKTGLSASRVLAVITILEIKGFVEQKPGKRIAGKVRMK